MNASYEEIYEQLSKVAKPLEFSNFDNYFKNYLIDKASNLDIELNDLSIKHFQALLNEYCKKYNI